MVTVIILTFNEEIHIGRCIQSVKSFTNNIIVIDSYSTDNTIEIAKSMGAKVYENVFINNAQQFQWALDNCVFETDWAMKLDADEVVTFELANEIVLKLKNGVSEQISGFQVKCRVHFMGKWIRWGYYPMVLNRLFIINHAFMEQKWMDEHIQLKRGKWILLENDIIDENLNNLSWWTNKHNNYATREAIMRLNYKYQFLKSNKDESVVYKKNKQIFQRMPLFFRCFLYFIYRYFFKLGFLDGKKGLIWHLLQGFWYQTLIDAKIFQIEYLSKKNNKTILEVIEQDFKIKVT